MRDEDERAEAEKVRRSAELRALMNDEAGRERLVAELLALEETLGVRIDEAQVLNEMMGELQASTDEIAKKLRARRSQSRRRRARAVSSLVALAYGLTAGVLVLIALGLAIIGLAQVVF